MLSAWYHNMYNRPWKEERVLTDLSSRCCGMIR